MLGGVSMEAVSADLASITEAATGQLNTRLDRAIVAEERITQTFVVGSIIAAIAFLAGAFLLGRAYRETASSEQMLQATLDSVREGVRAVDYRGHLRAWNSSLLAMLGVGGDNIRQGVPLSEAIASAGKLGRRVRGVEAAAPTTNRPVLAPVVEGFRRQSNSPNSPRRKPFSRR